MRIAQLAPVWERVPPEKYGGTEVVVSLLTEELIRRGHEVTLFATGDSITDANLVSCYDTSPPRSMLAQGNPIPDLIHTGHALRFAEQFDIIHDHTGYIGVAMGSLVNKPVLNTLHGIFAEDNLPFYEKYKDAIFYNSISLEQRRSGPDLKYVGNVYNAIDVDSYQFSQDKEDYFVYISRICQDKGTDIAIDVSLRANVKLIIAGKVNPGKDTLFYEEKIVPRIDGKQIIYKGEVPEDEKRSLLRDAKGFIFPLQWAEPFGLVMVEAMASGTPVIAFPYGSVPEIVKNGQTGFVVDNIEQMVEAVNSIERIDPSDCRRWVLEKFTVSRMVDEYEEIYKRIIELKADEKVAKIDISKPHALHPLEIPDSSPGTETISVDTGYIRL
ncbi:glycosyltransferase [Candidatus Methanoperedens nitroreducens]|uniref:Glycosyltransferase n=1 Tax=Candidatus Methanoperedens nitratireducens TaxID=1392998 RepID=A0A062V0I8_9EURY|nr:glycosyltransferase family 4 protein [Candidatus Methanoperedens nitroreducens]KCZ72661.1 glycosyltransferase [Candidatus Methanoperedens nitroreducens]MDJ1423407.1 glycosyltransferase family 4 protein [Candidatus Methanoperedens sp.]